ncbi:MAG: hypothetical protein KDK70_38890, partial [Myxococcales bacterium]|nr:hypothetical protein [Myxococcales bacterium]
MPAAPLGRCPLLALAGSLVLACGGDDGPPPAPLPPAGDTGGSDSGPPLPLPTGGGGLPAHCVLDEGDPDTGADGGSSDDGFKFDVGAPSGGSDFPVDCDEVQQTRSNLGCEFWAVDLP